MLKTRSVLSFLILATNVPIRDFQVLGERLFYENPYFKSESKQHQYLTLPCELNFYGLFYFARSRMNHIAILETYGGVQIL